MKKFTLLLSFLFCSMASLFAQEILPGISVRNLSGKIIVSWRNEYDRPVANINIQRSYDSLKNYTTIGSVLNPQNKENGYADAAPPYTKMYYRVFIAFECGSYHITTPVRPVKDTSSGNAARVRFPWETDSGDADPNLPVPVNPALNFPSKWIYTAKDNNVVLYLPGALSKKYTAVFFDELENKIFELTNLKEEYLIIEKVNFIRSGWYRFELFESGQLVEKNKFFIPKDGKITNGPEKKQAHR
jgi:hypothetical protein